MSVIFRKVTRWGYPVSAACGVGYGVLKGRYNDNILPPYDSVHAEVFCTFFS